jgi:hypothetical protein
MVEMERNCGCGRGSILRMRAEDLDIFPGLICVCGANAPMPEKDACPICGGAKWKYDLQKGWLRTCCGGAIAGRKPTAVVCPVCQAKPHKEDCGLWSPYSKEPM